MEQKKDAAPPAVQQETPVLEGPVDELQRARNHLAALMQSIEAIVWETDSNLCFTFVSPQAERLLGYPVTRWIEQRTFWADHIHPDDREWAVEYCRKNTQEKRDHEFEYRMLAADGRWLWIRDIVTVVLEQGEFSSLRGVMVDMTERRRTLEALSESRRLLEKAQQVGRIGSWVLHLGPAQTLSWSAETCRIFGLRQEDFDGRNESFFNLVHPGDLQAVARASVEARSEAKPYQIEHRIVRPDGEVRWVREQADVETDPDSRQPVRMIGVVQDITEQKRAQEEIEARENHFRLLIENASDLITVIDRRGIISYQSPASRRALGMAPEALVGLSAFDFVHPDDTGIMAAAIQRALNNPETPISVEYRFRHSSGSWRTLQSIGRNIPGKSSEGFIVVNSRDMTESRALEQQLAHSQKLQAVGTLAGGVAHDFNNLLGAIVGNADLALADLPSNHPAARCLAEILRASDRARQLVDRILAFGRPREPQRELIVISAVVEEAVRLLRSTLPAGVELQMKVAPELPPVRADVSQIHQVILNLGANSWHALEGRSGKIVFSLEPCLLTEGFCRIHPGLRAGPHVCLSVADSGKGMDKPTLSRIFEPFFTTKPPGQGTGLGLSVVHGIVHRHGGGIVVESTLGQGTEFRIYFPAVAAPGKTETGAAEQPPARALRGKGEHILFVDDEAPLVLVAVRSLERLGYRVTGLTSPLEAWEAFIANPASYALVLTDFNMPGLSGLQLAEKILLIRPDLPILMASGFLQPDQASRATKLGIRELMSKPYTTDQLSQMVQRWVANLPPAAL